MLHGEAEGDVPARVAAGPKGPPKLLEQYAHPAALRLAALHRARIPDTTLLQMEEELNHPSEVPPELQQADGVYALSFALQRAIDLLDVYIETEGDGGGGALGLDVDVE